MFVCFIVQHSGFCEVLVAPQCTQATYDILCLSLDGNTV